MRGVTKPATPGQKATLSVQVTPDVKNRIDTAAKANGCSQGAEITKRLLWTLDAETRTGGRALEMAMLLASAASMKYGSNWPDDPQCYASVKKLFGDLLDAVRPAEVRDQALQAAGQIAAAVLPSPVIRLTPEVQPPVRAAGSIAVEVRSTPVKKYERAWRERLAEITDPKELQRQLDRALEWDRRLEQAIDENVDEMLRPIQQQVDELLLAPVRQLMHEQFAELSKRARQRISPRRANRPARTRAKAVAAAPADEPER
jgi:hypothetical protein